MKANITIGIVNTEEGESW